MSYDDPSHSIWVSDLDGYIGLDAIFCENEHQRVQEEVEAEFECVGDISLFAGKKMSWRTLYRRHLTKDDWRWKQHHAETLLGKAEAPDEIEAVLLNTMMSMGRRYAIARYAALEGLSLSSAIAATLPHGIRALLYQFMASEQSLSNRACRKAIQLTLHIAASTSDVTAYDKVRLVQQTIHKIAIESAGANAHLHLSKDGMREVLSLSRLYFSVRECQVRSVSDLLDMNSRYERARYASIQGVDMRHATTGKGIRNWRLRFLHPLTFYFPYAVRNSLTRLIHQVCLDELPIERSTAVNELALAQCGIDLMRRSVKNKNFIKSFI